MARVFSRRVRVSRDTVLRWLRAKAASPIVNHRKDRVCSLHVYVSAYAVELALNVPSLEHQNVRAFGCVDGLMKGWSKRLSNHAAVQVNFDGVDGHAIKVNMGRNK